MFLSKLTSVQQFVILTVITLLSIGIIAGCHSNQNVDNKSDKPIFDSATSQPAASQPAASQPAIPVKPILAIETTNDVLPTQVEITTHVNPKTEPVIKSEEVILYSENTTKILLFRGPASTLLKLNPGLNNNNIVDLDKLLTK